MKYGYLDNVCVNNFVCKCIFQVVLGKNLKIWGVKSIIKQTDRLTELSKCIFMT